MFLRRERKHTHHGGLQWACELTRTRFWSKSSSFVCLHLWLFVFFQQEDEMKRKKVVHIAQEIMSSEKVWVTENITLLVKSVLVFLSLMVCFCFPNRFVDVLKLLHIVSVVFIWWFCGKRKRRRSCADAVIVLKGVQSFFCSQGWTWINEAVGRLRRVFPNRAENCSWDFFMLLRRRVFGFAVGRWACDHKKELLLWWIHSFYFFQIQVWFGSDEVSFVVCPVRLTTTKFVYYSGFYR